MGKFLAVDYGLERTGIAISDPGGTVAFPLATLRLREYGSRSGLLDALAALARDKDVENVVVGLPLYEDGEENLMCRQVRNMVQRLKRRIALPMYFMPELLSSSQALEDLKDAGLKPGKLNAFIDQQAACRILESFLAQPQSLWIPA